MLWRPSLSKGFAMQFSFRTLSTFTAALCFLLALVWGLMPQSLLAIVVELALGLGFIQTRRVSLELGETAG